MPWMRARRSIACSRSHATSQHRSLWQSCRPGPRLASRLAGETDVDVLQHGYAHTNHAVAPEKKIEIGLQRPAMLTLGELGTGWMALEQLFGSRALPVMVPPWNRISPVLVPTLPEIGYRGLSTFGPRPRVHPVRGLLQVNTHVDLIDWKRPPFRRRGDRDRRAGHSACARTRGRRRTRRGAQSSSCDGRRGVGFPKVIVGNNTDIGEHPRARRARAVHR